ncbi:RHS repeat-associated protein [Chitinophaga dinghuensis]|uniref:RHS repeat-associated protein n=1 Tax=Chitinophaga dinghuensis TaxID=1539050 RepID=A0A327VS80_9BACT|nr:DUF6443 domain-containing protein [Chitinophaga dinghuensis]RAJ77304.1 RHS repeat-associated protein [Chitinophaga dinghuensis]
MKKSIYTLLLLIGTMRAGAQNIPTGTGVPGATPVPTPGSYNGINLNYVRTWETSQPLQDSAAVSSKGKTVKEVKQSTVFLDGLGRPVQTVVKGISPTGKDQVSTVLYDDLGREMYKYLPYTQTTANTNDGEFKQDPFNAQKAFYENPVLNKNLVGEKIFYSQQVVETSPLGRVLNSYSPGNSWASTSNSGNHPVQQKYQVNAISDSVRIWVMGNNLPTTTAIYNAGQLFKNVIIDEAGNQVITFIDKNGRTICKRVQELTNPGTAHMGWLNTYYVYDDQGDLRFVLPPLAVQKITNNWDVSGVENGLCFQYRYDSRKRLIEKKLPGAAIVEMVYDVRDRAAFTRDGNLKIKGKWLVTFYDALNRPVETAFYNSAATRDELQSSMNTTGGSNSTQSYVFAGVENLITAVNDRTNYEAGNSIELLPGFDTNDGATQEFSINPQSDGGMVNLEVTNPLPNIPAGALTPLTFAFYDNYNFPGAHSLVSADLNKPEVGANVYPEWNAGSATNTKGLATGIRIRVLDTDQWLTTTNYYDEKGRVIQTIDDNASGGRSTLTSLYNFKGQLLSTYLRHANNKSTQHPKTSLLTITNYDDAGNIASVKKRLNDNPDLERTITLNTYDEMGRLTGKKLGINGNNPALEEMTFDYNIRGWLSGISKDYLNNQNTTAHFGQELSYDYGYRTPSYNGNISGIRWKGWNDKTPRSYGYEYDKVNRLLSGAFSQFESGQWNNNREDYSVKWISYDANGNILNMAQQGMEGTAIQPMDKLAYSYLPNSNKLAAVFDSSTVSAQLGDFKNGQNIGDDYTYDLMGNMVADGNKGISSITYNHLNLPVRIDIYQKGAIVYTYDAAGNKLKKTVTDRTVSPEKTVVTDYISGFVYQNDSLQFMLHEEGRIRVATVAGQAPTYIYDYFVKDHLGNTRLVLTENSSRNIYAATMETPVAAKETALFSNIDVTRAVKPAGYPSTDAANKSVSKLSAKDGGKKIGPSIVLRVMAGDTIQLGVKAFYKSTGPGDKKAGTAPVENMLADLVQAFGGKASTPGTHGISSEANGTPFNANFYNNDYRQLKEKYPENPDLDRPKAYLNYVLFDDQFNMVQENSGVKQVKAVPDQIQTLAQDNMVMEKSGFMYIYTSNETAQDVYFDDLVVAHADGPVLEETHYYPFGLTMAGISSNALVGTNYPKNRKEYNGIEHTTDLDLNQYDAFYRTLDPQIGRWNQIDPKIDDMEMWSPYTSNYDNPIRYQDFLGDEPGDNPGFWSMLKDAVLETGAQILTAGDGLRNSYVSNNLGGIGRVDVEQTNYTGKNAIAYQIGQKIGDAGAAISGFVEGLGGGAATVLTDGAAIPVTAPLVLHGTVTSGLGIKNLFSNPIRNAQGKTYQTYTKEGPNGEIYSGKTSGDGTPEQNIAKRDRGHHMNDQDYKPAQLDKTSKSKKAIRGREQYLIDKNGGAKSQGGTSGNAINSISPSNKKKAQYMNAAKKEFGE